MNLNIVLDIDVVLDLLAKHANDTQHCFTRVQKSPVHYWLPCCLLPVLNQQLTAAQQPLTALQDVHLLSNLAAHWHQLPPNTSNRLQAMVSLDAQTLPGRTVIWTNQDKFHTLNDAIEWGDHEFLYGVLAEYEYEEQHLFHDFSTPQAYQRTRLERDFFYILQKGIYSSGDTAKDLTQQLAARVNVAHSTVTNTTLDAVLLALLSIDLQAGDEVILSTFNHPLFASAVRLLGAQPVFVDIQADTYLIDPDAVAKAITSKTKAIVASNIFGQCADYDAIYAVAKPKSIVVIEDATQSLGAQYQGKLSGSLGDLAVSSLTSATTLDGMGEGGVCFSNDAVLIEKLQQHSADNVDNSLLMLHSPLNSLQAQFLLSRLSRFEMEIAARTRIGEAYTALLSEVVTTPQIRAGNQCVYATYTIQTAQRNAIQAALQKEGLPTKVYYPVPLHLQATFAEGGQDAGSLPVAEAACQAVLSLPMYPDLREDVQRHIVTTLKDML